MFDLWKGLLWLGSFMPKAGWFVIAGLSAAFSGQWFGLKVGFAIGLSVLAWAYYTDAFNIGWYMKAEQVERQLGKPLPKTNSSIFRPNSPFAPPASNKGGSCIPRPDPWPSQC